MTAGPDRERSSGHIPDDAELRAILGEEVTGDLGGLTADKDGKVVDLGWVERKRSTPPPDIRLIHITDCPPDVEGRRLVHVHPDTGKINYQLRAASDVYTDSEGRWVKVVEEWRYFAWLAMPDSTRPPWCPRAYNFHLTNLWVDPTTSKVQIPEK